MLTHLQIRDFAIIDLIELEVRAGLTVLTGETGAGKSIVVDALALLAGGKGGAEVVRAGAERAELSATFDISESPAVLRELLAEQSVEADDELTVRRVIATDGRSRSYLNGVSVPLTLLRDVGSMIVDIHGQHEFQSLTRSAAQRELLDDFGKNTELAGSVREAHKIWIALVNRTVELEGKARDRDSRIELLRHQVSELKALDLKENEVAQLAEERTRHSNRGRLAEAIDHFRRATASDPSHAEARNNLALALRMRGDRAEALQQFREALKLRPDWPQPMSEIAWLLATSPDPAMRSPAEAIRLAERAARLTSGREPIVLDALAAAYAAEGRFAEAVETAERAVAAAAATPGLAAELRSRLELYRSGRPFVEATRTRAAPANR